MRQLHPRAMRVISTIAHLSAGAAALLLSLAPAAAQAPARAPAQSQITYTKDVAPIMQRSCQHCHRPGSIAPMSFLTYEDVRPWARSIRQKVSTREMPPWYIDHNVGIKHFKDDPSLSNQEIDTIVKWVDGG